MTETTGSSSLEPRSGGSESSAETAPDAEQQSGGERDGVDLAALLAHGVGPETVRLLLSFNVDEFIAGGNPWPAEKPDQEPDQPNHEGSE